MKSLIYNLKKNVTSRSPDYGRAIEAAEKIFELLNLQPTIDTDSNDGHKIVSK